MTAVDHRLAAAGGRRRRHPRRCSTAPASSPACAHKDADADSLGSALGFALSMRAMGRDVRVVVPSPLPRMLDYLPGFDTIAEERRRHRRALHVRLRHRRPVRRQAGADPRTDTVVNIDHHVSNEGFGTINLIEATASATGQVVHRLLTTLGAPITADVATNLYAALFTDTGGFRHENTTEAALRLGADLVAAGADPGLGGAEELQVALGPADQARGARGGAPAHRVRAAA